MIFLRYLACAAAALIVSVSGGRAQGNAELSQYLGPLADFVQLGDDGTWISQVRGGWFTMENSREAGSVANYWHQAAAAQQDSYTIEMNLFVRALAGDLTYAGVMFDRRADDLYFGVLVGSDGLAYALFRTPDQGFNLQPVDTDARAVGDGSDRLVVTVTGQDADFTLNGVRVLAISSGRGFSPDLGVIAVGQGQFGFTNFAVTAR